METNKNTKKSKNVFIIIIFLIFLFILYSFIKNSSHSKNSNAQSETNFTVQNDNDLMKVSKSLDKVNTGEIDIELEKLDK